MIFNHGRTIVIFTSAIIAYLLLIYSFGRDEGTTTSYLPPIKTFDSWHIIRRDFEENGGSKGILFSTDFVAIHGNVKFLISYLMYFQIFSNVLFKIISQSI